MMTALQAQLRSNLMDLYLVSPSHNGVLMRCMKWRPTVMIVNKLEEAIWCHHHLCLVLSYSTCFIFLSLAYF